MFKDQKKRISKKTERNNENIVSQIEIINTEETKRIN